MRHASERVPGKNYRNLGARPLFHHVVTALLETPSIAQVIIDTDSPIIVEQTREQFPTVTLVDRPEHLRDGHTPMNDVLANTLTFADNELILQTHSTNPFVRAATFQSAIDALDGDDHDAIFGVTRIQGRLWSHDLQPMNHDPLVLARTQDLHPVYFENSCFYVFGRGAFVATGNRLGRRPGVVEVPALEAIDIDEESDFQLAEAMVAAGIVGDR
jgi:CMP-N-acetylneuraminic acid synthetase